MRLIILVLMVGFRLWGGYSFSRSITIDHTKVPNTDQTNFPVLVSGTYTFLKTVGNGGEVTNSSGFDIVFASDIACNSLYNFENERYIATTGEVIFWINIPTVATATDTVFYMCDANAAISTFQGNVNGTWNSAFKGVWHFPNGTSSLSLADSTSNGRNGSNGTTAPTFDVGKIGGGSSSTVTNTGYSTYSDTGLPATTTNRTISAWFGPKADGADPNSYILLYGKAGTNSQAQGMHATRQSIATCAAGTGDIYKITYVGWNDDFLGTLTFCSKPNIFHFVTLTFTQSGTVAAVYLDGAASGSGAKGSWTTTLTGTLFINEADPAVFAGNCSCVVDEVRISNVVRSGDWVATEYNNENSPSTFYTVGTATALGTKTLMMMGVGD